MNELQVNNDQTREESDNPDIVDALRAHYRDEYPAGSAGLVALVSPPQRRWWVGLGVAAAIVLVAALVIPRFLDDRSVVAEPPGGEEWVWVSHMGMQVEVPASWQFDIGAWCDRVGTPKGPHVLLMDNWTPHPAILCPPAPDPQPDQPPVLDFTEPVGPISPAWAEFPHTIVSLAHVIGSYRLTVHWGQDYQIQHPEITDIAARIISSASTVTADDNNGCPSAPTTTLTSGLTDLPEPDSVAVCQYVRSSLWSSRKVSAHGVHNLSQELRLLGSQPVHPTGESCRVLDPEVVMLHLNSGSKQYVVQINYQACSDTGVVIADGNHGMSKKLCEQVFVMPTTNSHMAEPLARRCGFPVPTGRPT
ncbi:hypothetical protein IPV09_02540 [Tessaracoccus sp. SD287]|uniref:hypothetical protein n=1 Tax=Tessaracoccus sp. SD287 TaxID=2782008 RepID=UPI001A96C125|nr:hypothetical protein [Tessaracoccus sp. SD287]MBO1030212.1 hypothetical protein [Tessaracoccus sp. SD287]